jgi:bis(5'-nucleosyl)-tetraphosphatase (symmetrical)
VHAGVVPQWDAARTLALAAEVEALLRGPGWASFLQVMYGNEPRAVERQRCRRTTAARFIVNVLTRIRFCSADGGSSSTPRTAPAPRRRASPWFEVPGRATAGHAHRLRPLEHAGPIDRPDLLALDTGCVWGGALSAVRVDGGRREWVQVPCAQAQRPGRSCSTPQALRRSSYRAAM